ncbi:3-hydroxyisobutyryl-CoA hydrolase [Thecaphora frezii]
MHASLVRSRLPSSRRLLAHPAAASLLAPSRNLVVSMPSPSKANRAAANRRLDVVSRHMSSSQPASLNASARTGAKESHHTIGRDDKVVQLYSEGGLRTIVLNREKALNAINKPMVTLLHEYIDDCVRSPHCNVILLRGKGRALCSGGDVLDIVKQAASSDPKIRAGSTNFFKDEFELDYKIARLGEAASVHATGQGSENARTVLRSKGSYDGKTSPKVFVSMMDGITMGGGVGLSVHAPFRVATERTLFAMPETGIGYFPDVGVTRVLARLDGKVGQYLGMTGARISGEEAYLVGLATHYISSSSIDSVAYRLSTLPASAATNPSLVASAISEFDSDPFGADKAEVLAKTPFLGDRRIALDYVFGQLSCEGVFRCLEEIASGSAEMQAASELAQLGLSRLTSEVVEWASQTLAELKTKSPRSLKVTHQAILEARRFDVEEAFCFDMRLATAFCDLSIGRDFYEGVTHVLERDLATGKRKQGVAKWDPPSLDKVSDITMRALFFADVETAKQAGLKMEVPELDRIPKAPSMREARQARDAVLRGVGPSQWEPTFNVFALPSEAEIDALRQGSHPAAAAVTPEDHELIDGLKRFKNDKTGLELKVKDYLDRLHRRRI